MRTLKIDDNWKDWKFGDTDAVMTFTALDDDQVPDFTNRTLTFKIADTATNDLEHPKDFAATATGYVQDKNVILKTEDVKQLTPGNYIVELWAMSNDTQKDAIYPSKGFAQFTIEENSMKVSDVTNIPSITINAFWNAVMQKVGTLTKGAKGDPGKTPKIVIGSVTKLAPNAQPSATLVPLQSDPNTYTLNLQLPQGMQGEQGIQGLPGTPGGPGLNGNDGLTPSIDPKTKHWMIGNTDTGIIAEGQPGKDADTSDLVTVDAFNTLRQDVKNNADALKTLQDSTKIEDLKEEVDGVKEKAADIDQLKADVANNKTQETDNATKIAELEKAIKALQDAAKPTTPDEPSSSSNAGSSASSANSEPSSSADHASSDTSTPTTADSTPTVLASSASAGTN